MLKFTPTDESRKRKTNKGGKGDEEDDDDYAMQGDDSEVRR